MKYRLKNQDLQKKLDDITEGGFSKLLEKGIPPTFFCEEFLFLGAGSIRVRLFESAFEEIPQYDPNRWNVWPDVYPPEGVDMRAEALSKDGKVFFKGAGYFKGGDWNIAGRWIDSDRRVRFRPWDDTTATLNKKILQEIIKALESHPEAYDLGYLIDDVTEAANELPDEEDK